MRHVSGRACFVHVDIVGAPLQQEEEVRGAEAVRQRVSPNMDNV